MLCFLTGIFIDELSCFSVYDVISLRIPTELISNYPVFGIYINNCPMRCNTKQSIYYSASSLYMFRVPTTPIIRSTQNCTYNLRYWSYFLCNYLPPTWPSLATLEGGSCTVPEVVVTVLCTPDDGCGWHAKHVEWTCRIVNRLLCVGSHRTVINIDQRCTEP